MTELHEIKAQARRDARKRRKTAASEQTGAADVALAVFDATIEVAQGDVVALYRAIQSELDPAPLADSLWERGITTCYPVVIAPDTPLQFRAADRNTAFIAGAFGAAIPDETAKIVTPSIVIAPLLAFDRALFRLGYGGGFYDRTLELLRAAAPTRAYGYAYAAQEVGAVPIEPTDQWLDGVITEAGFIERA